MCGKQAKKKSKSGGKEERVGAGTEGGREGYCSLVPGKRRLRSI